MTVLQAAHQQLCELETQLSASNPQLYRHLALYLQMLRDGLLASVQQACFHVATQIHPERYADLAEPQRLVLHRRMGSLVQRATSLLTVEQICHLAAQISREEHRQQLRQRSRLLEALEHGSQRELDAAQAGNAVLSNEAIPQGSVHLGLELPIGADFLRPGRFALPSKSRSSDIDEEARDSDDSECDQSEHEDAEHEAPALQAMAEALSDWMDQFTPSNASTPWDGGVMPSDPGLLLVWIKGFEAALARRLRNLSHALNVDLLRLGITRTLLPVSLLDAALSGQLETLEAPANLLRLPLPFGPEPGSPQLEAVALLLRSADLELAMPKLRTCRTRIQQHRQEVRRMAQHYRRIQRRVQALEAEQLWLQDINPAQPPPSLPE
ncbi:MAG: hypothetical protein WD136_00235 [Cyanobium sp.]